MCSKATSYIMDRIWVFFCGIALGISGNFAYDTINDYFASAELRQAAGVELFSRINNAHIAASISFDPRDALGVFSNVYKNTKSETDDERFEGRRIDNIIHTIYKRTSNENLQLLLEKIKYSENDTALIFTNREGEISEFEIDQYEKARRSHGKKMADYACCLANEFNIDDAMCRPPENYFKGSHYCLYIEGNLIVAPGRSQLMQVFPFKMNEQPRLYR